MIIVALPILDNVLRTGKETSGKDQKKSLFGVFQIPRCFNDFKQHLMD
jgi:hypothetical protein